MLAPLLASIQAAAQEVPTQVFEVPANRYNSNDTYYPGDQWNEYQVQVPKGHELNYSFEVVGEGELKIVLVGETGTLNILNSGVNYYPAFSTVEEVGSFSASVPPDWGFPNDFTILVNSTSDEPVVYQVNITVTEVPAPDYTVYYVLIGLGGIGVVVFSWYFVKWQVKKEKEAEMAAREERQKRRGRRRR